MKGLLKRSLTLRETVLIVVVLAALGGAGYWGYQFVASKLLEAKVNAVFPKVCDEIREERGKLVGAIEAYKAHFGFYPPDHVMSRQPLVVDPVTNTLFYELMGVVHNSTNKMYWVVGTEAAEEKYVKEFFQVDGFKNCGESADKVTKFLEVKPQQLHDDPDVFAVGFQPSYDGMTPEIYWEFEESPWRYVSSSPSNNPSKFDLWIELKTKNRKIVIGNWKDVE